MNWYYKVLGGHTQVRVFMNGGKCGDLCFRNEEFKQFMTHQTMNPSLIKFIPDTIPE